MVPDRIISHHECPPLTSASKEFLARSTLAVSVVLAATIIVTLLWRAEGWPGSVVARALVLGFGIAFGARFGAHGRAGGQMIVQIVIGAVSSALFNVIFRSAGL